MTFINKFIKYILFISLFFFLFKGENLLSQDAHGSYLSVFDFKGNIQDTMGNYEIELSEKNTFGDNVGEESLDLKGDAWVKIDNKLSDALFKNDKSVIKIRFKTLTSPSTDKNRRFIFGMMPQNNPGGDGNESEFAGGGDTLSVALDINDEADGFILNALFGNRSISFAEIKNFSAQTWHEVEVVINLNNDMPSAIFSLDGVKFPKITFQAEEDEEVYDIRGLREHLQKQSFYIGVEPIQIKTTGQDEVYDGIHDPSETDISVDYIKFKALSDGESVSDYEVVRDLLIQFTQYVSGNIDLSAAQQKTLMDSYDLEWEGSYEKVKSEVNNFLTSFDDNRQILFSQTRDEIYPSSMGYPEQLAFNIRQWIHDNLFKVGNISSVKGLSFPSAEVFPGLPKVGAPRVTSVDVSINGTYVSDITMGNPPALRLTGYYAAPGEVVTVEFDSSAIGKGLNIIIGAHIFDTEGRQKFNRFPRVSKKFPVESTSVDVANPFGGSVIIEIPDGVQLGEINVRIKNAINAPFYSTRSTNKTTTEEWNDDLSNAYLPWIEMESEKFIIIAPMALYDGKNPSAILGEWDAIMDSFSIAGGRPLERSRGEGVLVDSMLFMGGTMAPASYPINVNLDVYDLGEKRYQTATHPDIWSNPFNPKPSDTDTGKSKFIVLHELGHRALIPQLWEEHETIPNLPTVAAYNLAYGMDLTGDAFYYSLQQHLTLDQAALDWMISPNFRGNKRIGFDTVDFNNDGQELRYQSRGHAKYIDIADLFGWDEFSKIHKVFYDAANIHGSTVERGNLPRDDYYIRVASIALNKNLAPLFQFWGIIPSEALVRELSFLPTPEVIKTRLEHYKTLIPANNADFVSYYSTLDGHFGHQKIRYDNLSINYSESIAASIAFQIDGIIAKYFVSPENKSAPRFKEEASYKAFPIGQAFSFKLGVEDADTPQNKLSFKLISFPDSHGKFSLERSSLVIFWSTFLELGPAITNTPILVVKLVNVTDEFFGSAFDK